MLLKNLPENMSNEIKKFRSYLREKRIKHTPERIDVCRAVLHQNREFRIAQVYRHIKHSGWPISRATIYRTVPLLVDAGIIEKIDSDHSQMFRLLCSNNSDNVIAEIKCEHCGNNVKITNEIVEKIIK